MSDEWCVAYRGLYTVLWSKRCHKTFQHIIWGCHVQWWMVWGLPVDQRGGGVAGIVREQKSLDPAAWQEWNYGGSLH